VQVKFFGGVSSGHVGLVVGNSVIIGVVGTVLGVVSIIDGVVGNCVGAGVVGTVTAVVSLG